MQFFSKCNCNIIRLVIPEVVGSKLPDIQSFESIVLDGGIPLALDIQVIPVRVV